MMNKTRKILYCGKDVLLLPAVRAEFLNVVKLIDFIARETGLSDKVKKKLFIASDEIFTNIASYSYSDGKGDVKIVAEIDDDSHFLKLSFADKGIPYNPLETPAPDVTLPLEKRRVGGLGIFLVKKLMDGVEYHHDGVYNIITLKILLPA